MDSKVSNKSQPRGMFNFISEPGLKHLKQFEYVGGSSTKLDNMMQPFWCWFVTLIPLSIAPNMITLLGLVPNFLVLCILLAHDTTLTVMLPMWTQILAALSIFYYQTMDAVDGKQARRTGQSSPLGQLFDHGCDAMTTTFIIIMVIYSTSGGKETDLQAMLVVYTTFHITFYMAQWEEHFSHVLSTNFFGVLGVTEIQMGNIILIIFNAITEQKYMTECKVGEIIPQVNEFAPGIGQCSVYYAIMIIIGAMGLLQFVVCVFSVFLKIGPYEFCRSGVPALVPLANWGLATFATFSTTDWAWQHPALALLLLTPGYCLINSKLIVCNVTNMEPEINNFIFYLFFLFPLNKSYGLLYPEWMVALVILIGCLQIYSIWVLSTIGQIKQLLNINCLSIKQKNTDQWLETIGESDEKKSKKKKQ